MTSRQLTFPLAIDGRSDFASFRIGDNAELVATLHALALEPSAPGLWLWGEAGSGRSHLLKALCQEADRLHRSAIYLPLSSMSRRADVLENLDAGLIAIDDIDVWLGDGTLETALIGLYQQQLAANAALVLTCGSPARAIDFELADLASRFRALPSFRLAPLSDDDLIAILKASAHQRGLLLNDATAEFWMTRSRRSLPVLLAELDQLDRVALAEQRRLTIPLLKDVLEL
jgi:DnaA family protein